MSEVEDGKLKFIELARAIDPDVKVVIPSAPSNSLFLISLAKKNARKFMTVSEDDILDLTSDDLIVDEIQDRLRESMIQLKP